MGQKSCLPKKGFPCTDAGSKGCSWSKGCGIWEANLYLSQPNGVSETCQLNIAWEKSICAERKSFILYFVIVKCTFHALFSGSKMRTYFTNEIKKKPTKNKNNLKSR